MKTRNSLQLFEEKKDRICHFRQFRHCHEGAVKLPRLRVNKRAISIETFNYCKIGIKQLSKRDTKLKYRDRLEIIIEKKITRGRKTQNSFSSIKARLTFIIYHQFEISMECKLRSIMTQAKKEN